MEGNQRSAKLVLAYVVLLVLAFVSEGYLYSYSDHFFQTAIEIPSLEASGLNATFDIVRRVLGLIEGLINYFF